MVSEACVKKVKEKNSEQLLSLLNVVGVGVGEKITLNEMTDELAIRVYVNRKFPERFFINYPDEVIPPEIDGVPTDVIQIDEITKYDTISLPPERQQRLRPVPSGCSISHYAIKSRGTLCSWAKDKETGEPLLVSCWHVIANYGRCCQGDPIVQPSRLDGGRVPEDIIAYLERWVDVRMMAKDLIDSKIRIKLALKACAPLPWNYIDGAVAKPITEDVVSDLILGVGKIKKHKKTMPKRGMNIMKSGASTGVTFGVIFDVDVDIFVKYRTLGYAIFKNQILMANQHSWALANPVQFQEKFLNISF